MILKHPVSSWVQLIIKKIFYCHLLPIDISIRSLFVQLPINRLIWRLLQVDLFLLIKFKAGGIFGLSAVWSVDMTSSTRPTRFPINHSWWFWCHRYWLTWRVIFSKEDLGTLWRCSWIILIIYFSLTFPCHRNEFLVGHGAITSLSLDDTTSHPLLLYVKFLELFLYTLLLVVVKFGDIAFDVFFIEIVVDLGQ